MRHEILSDCSSGRNWENRGSYAPVKLLTEQLQHHANRRKIISYCIKSSMLEKAAFSLSAFLISSPLT